MSYARAPRRYVPSFTPPPPVAEANRAETRRRNQTALTLKVLDHLYSAYQSGPGTAWFTAEKIRAFVVMQDPSITASVASVQVALNHLLQTGEVETLAHGKARAPMAYRFVPNPIVKPKGDA